MIISTTIRDKVAVVEVTKVHMADLPNREDLVQHMRILVEYMMYFHRKKVIQKVMYNVAGKVVYEVISTDEPMDEAQSDLFRRRGLHKYV